MKAKNERARAAWALRKQGFKFREIQAALGIKTNHETRTLCGRGCHLAKITPPVPVKRARSKSHLIPKLLGREAQFAGAIGHGWKEPPLWQ